MAAKTQSNRDSGSTDDFLFEQKLTTSCPKCGARMSGHAIVCLDCGHNKQSGKAQETWPGGLPSASLPSVLELVDPAEAAEQPLAQSMQDRGKKWIFSAVLFAGPLCVGSFYSKAIGMTAGMLAVCWQMYWVPWRGFSYNAILWLLLGAGEGVALLQKQGQRDVRDVIVVPALRDGLDAQKRRAG